MKNVSQEEIVDFLIEKVCAMTKQPKDSVAGNTDLALIGMDSLRAVMLCGYIEEMYDIEVEPILMFEYKTANDAATAILKIIDEQA